MSRWEEDTLEEACARGDEPALDEAFRLLDEPHAYTRARASEMLSLAPEGLLAGRLAARFDQGFPPPLIWRVIALYANEHGRPPGGDATRRVLTRAAESPPSALDADAVYYVISALAEAGVEGADRLVEKWVSHDDEEVALAAASLVARTRRLRSEELKRLGRFSSGARFDAMMLRVEHGDESAVVELARAIGEAGPLAFEALEVLERHGGAAALGPLRETWGRRFGVGHLAARTAASAVVLGDGDALRRLRDLARSWRRATRSVALAELVRVGSDEDFDRVAVRVGAGGPEAAHVAAEAWRRTDGRAVGLILDAFSHPEPEVRAAACESAARLPDVEAFGAPLTRCLDDPSPAVADAARDALSERRIPVGAAKKTWEPPKRSHT